MKKKGLWVKLIIFLGILVLLFVIVNQMNLTVDDLIAWTPDNRILAFFTIMAFFALKSLSIVLPVPLLYLLNSHLFGEKTAILVNLCGLSIGAMVPYWIGRRKGKKVLEELNANDKLKIIHALQTDNPFFTTYILRMFQLPMDLVSLYLGTEQISGGWYLLGSLAGMSPVMIGITLTGDDILSPSSPQFLSSFLSMIVIIIASFVLFYFIVKYRYPERLEIMKNIIAMQFSDRKNKKKAVHNRK